METWAADALSQIVRLKQYYEHDPLVLGLCGQKAQLLEKFGINKIDDDLLEQEVTVRVSVGLGAGDPQQRLERLRFILTRAEARGADPAEVYRWAIEVYSRLGGGDDRSPAPAYEAVRPKS